MNHFNHRCVSIHQKREGSLVNTMNAQELIEKLTALTEEEKQLPVHLQGCDCVNDAVDVEVERGEMERILLVI